MSEGVTWQREQTGLAALASTARSASNCSSSRSLQESKVQLHIHRADGRWRMDTSGASAQRAASRAVALQLVGDTLTPVARVSGTRKVGVVYRGRALAMPRAQMNVLSPLSGTPLVELPLVIWFRILVTVTPVTRYFGNQKVKILTTG